MGNEYFIQTHLCILDELMETWKALILCLSSTDSDPPEARLPNP